MKHIEILITASLADGDDMLGHKAAVQVHEPSEAIVQTLSKMGLKDAKCRVRVHTKKPRNATAPVSQDAEVDA